MIKKNKKEAAWADVQERCRLSNVEIQMAKGKRRSRASGNGGSEFNMPDSDFYHAVIAGYTDGGFSYGMTWEEWERMQAEEALLEWIESLPCYEIIHQDLTDPREDLKNWFRQK